MKTIKTANLIPVIYLMIFGCIEPLEYDYGEATNYLVVEGVITTEDGPHMIKLTTTRNVSNENNKFKLAVEGADVEVSSSLGEKETLVESEPGVYFTSDRFRGQVGQSHHLTIETKDRKRYVSNSAHLKALPRPDSLSIHFGSFKTITSYNSIQEREGFFINALIQNEDSAESFFHATWDYTYKIETGGGLPNVCWVSIAPTEFSIFSDELSESGVFAEHPLFFLPVTGVMLAEKIKVQVRLTSLAEPAYDFMRLIYDANYNQGGIFDPPPAYIPSNISNIDNPEETVLGYFYASDVATVSRNISARDFPGRISTETGFLAPCTLYPLDGNARITDTEPENWTE